ncbi:uncharacterized protein LOC135089740 isoform X2 [Scylla paramamosain]
MAIISGINLGVGINTSCWEYDTYCETQRKAWIISGSCFAVSAFFFLVGAISLHLKIKQALKRHAEVLAQQGAPPIHQTTGAYPTVVMAAQYPPTQPYNPAAIGFVVTPQAPPIASYPGEQEQQQRPPPYSP